MVTRFYIYWTNGERGIFETPAWSTREAWRDALAYVRSTPDPNATVRLS